MVAARVVCNFGSKRGSTDILDGRRGHKVKAFIALDWAAKFLCALMCARYVLYCNSTRPHAQHTTKCQTK